jgi:hypothetical protein
VVAAVEPDLHLEATSNNSGVKTKVENGLKVYLGVCLMAALAALNL